MTAKSIRYKNSTLQYEVIGNGKKGLLLFHGYGQERKAFAPFVQTLSASHTLFIFDLYFHGESEWGLGEKPLEKQHWKETMIAFLNDNEINKFSVVGFSLGGKFALATLEAFPERLDSLLLLAPDGIKTSFWYSLATYPVMFRSVFKLMIRHHSLFLSILHFFSSLKVVDKGLIRFAELQMNSAEKRRKVYYSWVVLRKLKFKMAEIGKLIVTHAIPVTIITGKYDKVIPSKNMNRLFKRLKTYRHIVLETGHNGLIENAVPFLAKALK